MSWMNDLYQTYEKNLNNVGKKTTRGKREFTLLPINHAYANAQIEVTVTTEGDFFSARIVPKAEAPTMIPVTAASGSRSSGYAPHTLHDTLKYTAGDYVQYGGVYKKDNPFELYLTQLAAWCDSNEADSRVTSIYHYLRKGTLITDLVREGFLPEENGKIVSKWGEIKENTEKYPEKPEIFSVIAGEPINAFVRFTTHETGNYTEKPVWEDMKVVQAYTSYCQNHASEANLDYVTGEVEAAASFHPSGIRYGGDMAKLISANDTSNFTFRGRFFNKDEAAIVGFKTSQEAHNALRWLIAKQGYTLDGRVYLTWGESETDIVSPMLSTREQLFGIDEAAEAVIDVDTTQREFAKHFTQALQGYQSAVDIKEAVHMMILDAATPGRMSILYYQTVKKNQYLERIENWRKKSEWRHGFRTKDGQWAYYWGVPNLKEIAEAAYSSRASDKVINNAVENLFSCVADGRKVPENLYRSLLQRASNPMTMENWEWQKAITTACSITHNYFYEEGISLSLDKNYTNRSYLFGRLLAVAHILESSALRESGQSRATNAQRYMTAFSMQPVRTWKIIRENLEPYIIRLGGKATFYEKLFQEITDKFTPETYTDAALDGKYLMGFDSQQYAIYNKENSTDLQNEEEDK